MTSRECFRSAMHFEGTDCLLWHEAVPDETIMRWIKEGMPLEEALPEQGTELSARGGMIAKTRKRTLDVSRHFGFMNLLSTSLEIELGPLPRFVPKTLQQDDNWIISLTEHGVTQKVPLEGRGYVMPQFLDYPVKTEKDWEEYEKRLDPVDPRRYPKIWSAEYIEHCRNSTAPVGLSLHGFHAIGRELMGTVAYLTAFYDAPGLVHRMLDYWADFLLKALKPAVEALGSDIDFIFWHEDMAYKNGPFFRRRYSVSSCFPATGSL